MDFLKQAYNGLNDGGRYAIGILLVILGYGILGQIPLLIATGLAVNSGNVSVQALKEFGETNKFSLIGVSNNVGFLLMLSLFVFAALGMYGALKIHKKNVLDIITVRRPFDWSRFVYATIVWFVIIAIAEMILYSFSPDNYTATINLKAFLPLVIISLLLIPIQSGMEEIFFRGYINQGIYLITKKPMYGIIASTVFFSFVHSMNPEIEKFGFIPMQLYYLTAGFFLAFLAYLDNGLELSIGIHSATNIFGATCVTYEGAVLQTDTLFKMKETNPWLMTFTFVLTAVVFFVIAMKKYKWNFIKP
jgi:uncharacterized protein